ncbi:glycine zipper 2TM domain-containing protein [Caenimonas sedimenti]|jgi:osmotically inducible lipoprotein OsmB|uniref:Glycine zipper 2TM domain-containing protein n=1 Tax=Caenimonas sedimenti TaxID=2596921 RepID=A0A562ZK37_9BURK|nr:glycine zipper 2TM domain-containing protein [Caenimonas sedimenti]TWO68686.1 glycine zipper 2TM domain-containing protein [Caenimonas sedimenti]
MQTNSIRTSLAIAVLAVATLSGCAGMSHRDQSTVGGAAIGGVAGAVLTGGSVGGTLGGAAIGGVIGNQIAK